MKERPILFSWEMVRAILDGRKTQTRRKMKPRPPSGVPEGVYCDPYNGNFEHFTFWTQDDKMCSGLTGNVKIKGKPTCHWTCPYGVPGDRLWVRETFAVNGNMPIFEYSGMDAKTWTETKSEDTKLFFCADYPAASPNAIFPYRWRPSIHMPRWASRITLEIVNEKVERLHDISAEDCIAEGIEVSERLMRESPFDTMAPLLKGNFRDIWQSINRPGSWEKNPWVWVVEFNRVMP